MHSPIWYCLLLSPWVLSSDRAPDFWIVIIPSDEQLHLYRITERAVWSGDNLLTIKKISFNKLTLCFVQFYNSNFAVSDKTIHHYPNYVIAYEGGRWNILCSPKLAMLRWLRAESVDLVMILFSRVCCKKTDRIWKGAKQQETGLRLSQCIRIWWDIFI